MLVQAGRGSREDTSKSKLCGTHQHDEAHWRITRGDQLDYIGDVYLRRVTFNTKVEEWFLSTLNGWRRPISWSAGNQMASSHLKWGFMTMVQQTQLVLLRRSYLMLSRDNDNELTKGSSYRHNPMNIKRQQGGRGRGSQITNFVTTSFMDDPLVSGESVVVTLVDRDS